MARVSQMAPRGGHPHDRRHRRRPRADVITGVIKANIMHIESRWRQNWIHHIWKTREASHLLGQDMNTCRPAPRAPCALPGRGG